MIDFHSHILPNMDDGASSVEVSLKMLELSKSMGIDTVVSTSHCYPYKLDADISAFLEMRKKALNEILPAISENPSLYPDIVLGCEVHLVKDLSKCKDLKKLCIENTDYLLLEMPSTKWTDVHYEEIYHMTQLGIKPIIAHLDRYPHSTVKLRDLLSLPVLIQVNAEAFNLKSYRQNILDMFFEDAIHVIGSDMHNLTSRPPNLANAYNIIDKKFGKEYTHYLKRSCQHIVNNEPVSCMKIKKPSILKKLFI